ncbi:hypothetical protein METP1_02692 [Methanosarcinales archaeon]|nr:hypothetical protein METP1_02692 [Methanosarcinales archaeon]
MFNFSCFGVFKSSDDGILTVQLVSQKLLKPHIPIQELS